MFNNKKKEIAELKNDLFLKNGKIKTLLEEAEEREKYIKSLEEAIEKLTELNENVPEDCKEGEWCQACEFGKYHRVYKRYGYGYQEYYYCGKKEACNNFVERKDRNSDQN